MRVWLRRQGCSRKLQRMWRTFADRHQTSRQLAVSFIRTGVPSVVLPPTPPTANAAAKPAAFQSAEQPRTPANTAANTPTATPTGSPSKAKGSGPAIAWVGVNTHVTEGADLDPSQQPQDAFEKFAKAIQSPATLRNAKVFLSATAVLLGCCASCNSSPPHHQAFWFGWLGFCFRLGIINLSPVYMTPTWHNAHAHVVDDTCVHAYRRPCEVSS